MLQGVKETRSKQNDLNSIMTSMIRAGLKPTTLQKELDSKGISFDDFLKVATGPG